MIAVWKFPLVQGNVVMEQQAIEMPMMAEILRVGFDSKGVACVWAKVNTDCPNEYRRFGVYATGMEIDVDVGDYVGSMVVGESLALAGMILHVFEING